MEVIKKIVDTLKINQFIRILVELTLLVMLFNVHIVLGGIFTIVILLEIILTKDNKNLLFIYLFLSFFDEVLVIDIIHGSVSRIIMVVIFIKLMIYIMKNRIIPNKYQVALIAFFIVSFLIGVITIGFNLEVILIFFNIVIFTCFSMVLKFKDIEEVDYFIETLCFTIVVAVLNSVLYGIMTNNFLEELEGTRIVYRFKGTYEPNFMCLYSNLAILSLITIKEKFSHKILYYFIGAIFVNTAIATVSMTGITTLGLAIFIYVIFKRKNWKKELLDLLGIIMLTIVIFGGIQISNKIIEMRSLEVKEIQNVQSEQNKDSNTVNKEDRVNSQTAANNEDQDKKSGLGARIEWLEELLMDGRLETLTSGRLPLARTFIQASFNRPILNILLGNDARSKTLYCNFFDGERYSHNSYIDCLYNFGIIGFFIAVGFVWYRTIKNIYFSQCIVKSNYAKNIKLIRIMLLVYALALSLYTKRMFLVFFLL